MQRSTYQGSGFARTSKPKEAIRESRGQSEECLLGKKGVYSKVFFLEVNTRSSVQKNGTEYIAYREMRWWGLGERPVLLLSDGGSEDDLSDE